VGCGFRGAKHAHFSAFVEVVLPDLSWEMASRLCDSKSKGEKSELVPSGVQPFEDQLFPPAAMRISSVPSCSVDSESKVKYGAEDSRT